MWSTTNLNWLAGFLSVNSRTAMIYPHLPDKKSNEIRWQVDAIILHGGLGVTSEALLARGTWNLAAKTNGIHGFPMADVLWFVWFISTDGSLVVWGPVLWDSRGTS